VGDADEAYGKNSKFRLWLREQHMPYVLAVVRNQKIHQWRQRPRRHPRRDRASFGVEAAQLRQRRQGPAPSDQDR
jgi:hypothetical protein